MTGFQEISEEAFRRIRESREEIGRAGENWVINHERNYLIDNGKNELAQKVIRVSETNISAGYDILSFEIDDSEKYIEVKTTALSKVEFFISANELDVAERLNGNYWIYLVSEIYGEPRLVTIQDPVKEISSNTNQLSSSSQCLMLLLTNSLPWHRIPPNMSKHGFGTMSMTTTSGFPREGFVLGQN
jgi:hypothetical protein